MVPDTLTTAGRLGAGDYFRLNERDLAVDDFVTTMDSEDGWLNIEWASFSELDGLRSHPGFQAYMASQGLPGFTVQRTPVDERVRPAILRQADVAAAAAESSAGSAR